jgi:hypothetical protein
MVVDEGCRPCEFMRPVIDELVSQSSATGVQLVTVDVWDEPEAVIELEAITHPTLILFTGGHERARVAGPVTERQLLRKFLPYLYPDPDDALTELRRRVANPGETFPARHRPFLRTRDTSKIALLRDVPMFSAMSKRQLALIAHYSDETVGVTGQSLATEGDVGDHLYLICTGSAVVTTHGTEINRLGAGECFGEMALLDGQPRSASVALLEDSQLLTIHRRDFTFLLDQVPGIAREMLVVLSRRLRAADNRLLE